MGLEIFMGSVWVGSLKRITEIGRDGDMYWMLKMNWFSRQFGIGKNLCTKFWSWVLQLEKNNYRYDGILQSCWLSPEIGFEHGKILAFGYCVHTWIMIMLT